MVVTPPFSTSISSAWAVIPAQQSNSTANAAERTIVIGKNRRASLFFVMIKSPKFYYKSNPKSRTNVAYW
jgi:hypothetical protein